jgi:sugar phosphate isomerase/epimerase
LLGVSLDTAQLTAQGEPLQAAFMACADRTWTVQLTDAKLPSPYRLRPGLGDVDWLAVSDVLRAIGYQGPCTLHLENYVDTPDSAAQLALDDAGRLLRRMMPVA